MKQELMPVAVLACMGISWLGCKERVRDALPRDSAGENVVNQSSDQNFTRGDPAQSLMAEGQERWDPAKESLGQWFARYFEAQGLDCPLIIGSLGSYTLQVRGKEFERVTAAVKRLNTNIPITAACHDDGRTQHFNH